MENITIEQLKAHAYDCMSNIETWKKELELTNQAISNYKTIPIAEDKKVEYFKKHK